MSIVIIVAPRTPSCSAASVCDLALDSNGI